MHTTAKTLFDVGRANRELPLIRTIVRDMVTDFKTMRAAGKEQRVLQTETMGSGRSESALAALRETVNDTSACIERYLHELEELGVEVRDLEIGLIDFPATMRGEPAFLCWRYDEPEVAHWHPAGKGFADRVPIQPPAPRADEPSQSPHPHHRAPNDF